MPKREWDAEVQLSSDPESADQLSTDEHDPDRKLVIGVLADFRGPVEADSGPASVPLAKRKFHDIDRDNFDEILARFGVRWRGRLRSVPGEEAPEIPVELAFRELDDFHPDRIVARIPVLSALQGLLTELEDPARFDAAAAKISAWAGLQEETPPAPRPAAASAPVRRGPVDGGQLLDAILEQHDVPLSQPSDIDRLVREIVQPHQVRMDTRRQEAMADVVNRTLSHQVNSVLHDPAFRSSEALWRGLRRLVDAAGSETAVRIAQVRKDELLSDVTSGKSLEASGLAGLLIDPMSVPGTARFSLLVGGYEFCHDLEDLAVLERLGNIGARLKAPFVAAAGAGLFGCRSFTELPDAAELERLLDGEDYRPWRLLRQTRPARWLALAAPRLLCRLPYGPQTEVTESFSFDEMTGSHEHEQYLWGNPAFAIATVFAGAFAESGWQMNPAESVTRIEGLPLHVYKADGESVTKPCAEILMGEQTMEALMDAGLLPLVSYRDADIVSLPSLQSLAHPRTPLRL